MTDDMLLKANLLAVKHIMEGSMGEEPVVSRIIYSGAIAWHEKTLRAECRTTIDMDRDGVIAVFHADAVVRGPYTIGVTLLEGAVIKLQFGQLWFAPKAERAVVVPRNVGRHHGHYAVEKGRIVQRTDWPAAELERGTRRARHRLTDLTDVYLNTLMQDGAAE